MHTSKQLATEEVNRLQEQNPENNFVILKSVSYSKVKITFEQVSMDFTLKPQPSPIKKTIKKKESCTLEDTYSPTKRHYEDRFAQQNYWKSSNNRYIKINEMTNEHLLNIISMLERRVKHEYKKALETAYNLMNLFNGDVAVNCIEQEIQNMEIDGPDAYKSFPIMYNLTREKLRRGI